MSPHPPDERIIDNVLHHDYKFKKMMLYHHVEQTPEVTDFYPRISCVLMKIIFNLL